jgi:addiction module HigA family antidote
MSREFVARRPDRAPTHPGVVLRDTILPSLNMPVTEAAAHLGVTRQTLHRILSERTAVTPEMAIRLGKFCGNGPGLWLRMQQAYDLWHASEKLRDEVARIPTATHAA